MLFMQKELTSRDHCAGDALALQGSCNMWIDLTQMKHRQGQLMVSLCVWRAGNGQDGWSVFWFRMDEVYACVQVFERGSALEKG